MLFVSSKLDAVNAILASVGDSPINSLQETQSVDVFNAIRMLDAMSRTIQSKGWTFNTHEDKVVKPDSTTKKIRYNPAWIVLKSDEGTYVKRGEYLYNITDDTYIFNDDLTATIIEAVDFEDLPDCFKQYITAKSAIAFQSRYLGDDSVSQMLMAEAQEAYGDIVQYSIDTGVNGLQVAGIATLLSRSD